VFAAACEGGSTVHEASEDSVSENDATHHVALLLVDVVNHFDFPDGADLLKNATPIAQRLSALKQRARTLGLPTIYVNDNFGRWRSNFPQVLECCLNRGGAVRAFVEQIQPDANDYLVLKPKHSAFYQTPLDLLLKYLAVNRLVITGLATNSCILCTANDAYMRDLTLVIPEDCCAARTSGEHQASIEQMQAMLSADVTPSISKDFKLSSLTEFAPPPSHRRR
jgi:nicotinamidase-related amidase